MGNLVDHDISMMEGSLESHMLIVLEVWWVRPL